MLWGSQGNEAYFTAKVVIIQKHVCTAIKMASHSAMSAVVSTAALRKAKIPVSHNGFMKLFWTDYRRNEGT